MGDESTLSTALAALKRNPALFVASFAVALLNSLYLGLQLVAPEFQLFMGPGSLVVHLVSLFFVGGGYAMAHEGLRERTNLDTLFSEGRDNYLSLLGGTLALIAVTAVVLIFFVVAAFIVVFAIIFSTVDSGNFGAFGLLGVVVIGVAYLLGLAPLFFLQFYGPAVVVSGESAGDSIRRSYRLVRRNVLSTLGFDTVAFVVTSVGAVPIALLYWKWWQSMAETLGESAGPAAGAAGSTTTPLVGLDPATAAPYLLATLVLTTFTGAFFWTYQVAFYENRLLSSERGTDDSPVSFDAEQ